MTNVARPEADPQQIPSAAKPSWVRRVQRRLKRAPSMSRPVLAEYLKFLVEQEKGRMPKFDKEKAMQQTTTTTNQPIYVSTPEPKQFELASEGMHNTVIREVKDLGDIITRFGPKPKVLVKYEVTDEIGEQPIFVFQRFTKSLHEKASLTELVTAALGGSVTGRLDLQLLVGKSVRLSIVHKKSQDGSRTFANVVAIKPGVDEPPKPTKKAAPKKGGR